MIIWSSSTVVLEQLITKYHCSLMLPKAICKPVVVWLGGEGLVGFWGEVWFGVCIWFGFFFFVSWWLSYSLRLSTSINSFTFRHSSPRTIQLSQEFKQCMGVLIIPPEAQKQRMSRLKEKKKKTKIKIIGSTALLMSVQSQEKKDMVALN